MAYDTTREISVEEASKMMQEKKNRRHYVDIYRNRLKRIRKIIRRKEKVVVMLHKWSTEESWKKECPDWEHDCCTEGCGQSVTDSYEFGEHITCLLPNKTTVTLFLTTCFEQGGLGV